MRDKRYHKSVFRSFTMILQIGINMLVCIGMMTALGIYLDKKCNSSFWMIIFFVIGALAGLQSSYRMLKRVLKSAEEPNRKSETTDQVVREIERMKTEIREAKYEESKRNE